MKKKVLNLRPTQFAVGMLEVDEKICQVKAMKKSERHDWIRENVVPVVRDSQGTLFVVDKHHFLSVCYNLGIKKVFVDIIHDFKDKDMSYLKFWSWMKRSRNTYPYCQFGEGPRDWIYLPKDVRGLADDPYRSIAWFVRKAGAFENSEKNFSEFLWANFFREKNLLKRHGMSGFTAALTRAVILTQSKEARKLPGYDKLDQKRLQETLREAVEKGKKALER